MAEKIHTRIEVNGVMYERLVEPRQHLVDYLRDELGIKGARTGCEHGVCGACTVRLNGDIVRGCLVLAVQADGASVQTIEGASDSGELTDLQGAFHAHNALQCGFCTPGMLFAAQDLVDQKPDASRQEIREHIAGNYCRCTGYHAIVDAISDTLERRGASAGKPT